MSEDETPSNRYAARMAVSRRRSVTSVIVMWAQWPMWPDRRVRGATYFWYVIA